MTSHKEIFEWLKTDYGLGTGHARAITHVILHGSEFTMKQTTGAHRDTSGSPNLGGKEVTEKKATKKKPASSINLVYLSIHR